MKRLSDTFEVVIVVMVTGGVVAPRCKDLAGSPRLSNVSQVAVNCRNPTKDMQVKQRDVAKKGLSYKGLVDMIVCQTCKYTNSNTQIQIRFSQSCP